MGEKFAITTMKITLSEARDVATIIPAGTRGTAGLKAHLQK